MAVVVVVIAADANNATATRENHSAYVRYEGFQLLLL